jgi:molybdopterin-guanine dinucleotide biosynthesis protein A
LPDLADEIGVVHDRQPDRGPMEGLAVGLTAIAPHADAAYVTGCDVPLLSPAFVRRMIDQLGRYDIAVPKDGKYHHPLAAVYRTRVVEHAQRLLDANRRRPFYLFSETNTREVPVGELREVDPQLLSLENVNGSTDYLAASKAAGFAVPDEIAIKLRG